MSLVDNPASKALDSTNDAIPLRGNAAVRGWEHLRTWPPSLRIGVGMLVIIVAVLVATPWVAPYDPAAQVLTDRLQGPGSAHLLGNMVYLFVFGPVSSAATCSPGCSGVAGSPSPSLPSRWCCAR